MVSMLSEIESKRNDLQKQKETIRKSGEFIERIIDTMDEILILLSTNQTILKVNKKFLQIMGFSEADVIDKTPDFLFSKESLNKIHKINSPDSLYKSEVYRIFTIRKNFEWVVELVNANGEKSLKL